MANDSDIDVPLPVTLSVNFGAKAVDMHDTKFTYRNNPTISSIVPYKTFQRLGSSEVKIILNVTDEFYALFDNGVNNYLSKLGCHQFYCENWKMSKSLRVGTLQVATDIKG